MALQNPNEYFIHEFRSFIGKVRVQKRVILRLAQYANSNTETERRVRTIFDRIELTLKSVIDLKRLQFSKANESAEYNAIDYRINQLLDCYLIDDLERKSITDDICAEVERLHGPRTSTSTN